MISSNPIKLTRVQQLTKDINLFEGYIQECTSYRKRFITNSKFIIYLLTDITKRNCRTNTKWFKDFISTIGKICFVATYSIIGLMDKDQKSGLEENIYQRDILIDELMELT